MDSFRPIRSMLRGSATSPRSWSRRCRAGATPPGSGSTSSALLGWRQSRRRRDWVGLIARRRGSPGGRNRRLRGPDGRWLRIVEGHEDPQDCVEQDQAAVQSEGQQHEQRPRRPRIDADPATKPATTPARRRLCRGRVRPSRRNHRWMLFIVFSRLVVLAGNASSLRQRESCGYRGTPWIDPGGQESLMVAGRGPGRVPADPGGPRRRSAAGPWMIRRRPPDRATTATG